MAFQGASTSSSELTALTLQRRREDTQATKLHIVDREHRTGQLTLSLKQKLLEGLADRQNSVGLVHPSPSGGAAGSAESLLEAAVSGVMTSALCGRGPESYQPLHAP